MADLSHLDAIELRLSHERARLAAERDAGRKALRAVWVAQIERELAAEYAHLGLPDAPLPEMTDDELLAALES